MAEKNEKKNEAEVMEPAAAETVNSGIENIGAMSGASFDLSDMLPSSEDAGVREGTTTIYPTSLLAFFRSTHSEKHKMDLRSYFTGVSIGEGESKFSIRVNLTPYPNHLGSMAIADRIVGAQNGYPLEVIKRVTEYNGEKSTSYSFRISGKDPATGMDLICEFRNDRYSGGTMLENLLSFLRSRGEIK